MRYTPPPNTQFIGQRIIYEAACTSTNSLAAQYMTETSLPEGTVVITDHQYQGRGQRGHLWHSEPHKNLLFSVVLYPSFLTAQQSFSLNIITTLAVQHALTLYTPSAPHIKWPNDIYYQDQKLGGVLIENIVEKRKLKASVIGIGLNINQVCFNFPNAHATSLSNVCQRTFDLQQLFAQLLTTLEDNYLQLQAHGIASLKTAYLKNMYWIHEIHTFRDATHSFQGKIIGIDAVGKLVIDPEDGTSKRYNAKEVSFGV